MEPFGQLSIEEAFSKFFLLQGMTNQLKQYGYNFFDVSFTGFPQITDMPIGPDYVLGPEDTLAIHIWNVPDPSFNRSYIGTIERDGTLFIPQLGSIPMAGATFGQAQQIIHSKLSGLLKRFDFHMTMGRLRSIKVYVVGEVVRPGAYELSSLATASHALYAACGPAKSGSLRHIQVIRANKVVSEVDFYEFFIKGDRSHDIQLRSGDTLVVAPIGAVAAIGGPVRRPAIYEIKNQTTLPELVDLAGGLAPSADRRHCRIFRVEAGQKRVILDVETESLFNGSAKPISTAGAPVVNDGDFIQIVSVPLQIENAVTLAGAVRTPGVYELKPGMKLLDILKPEQLLLDSYLDKAELVRTDPMTYETSIRPFSVKALLQGKEENVELRRLDKVVVGSQVRGPWVVSILGEVKRPGSYTLETGERLSSVLKRAGGLTARAFPQGLVLIRDSVAQRQQNEINKFVALQKQRLTVEAAAVSAGTPAGPGTVPGQPTSDALALQFRMQALDQLLSKVQVGRVVLDIQSIETLEGSDDDVVLEASDHITIPPVPKTVTILGAVRNSTNVLYREDYRVDDYLREAGGFIEDANEEGMYIVRANGSAEAGYAKVKTVLVGDTIIVPEKTEIKTKPLALWTAVAQIFGSLGLLAAALVTIGR
jgi:protein involved in polysaccharide export with SLBB domain